MRRSPDLLIWIPAIALLALFLAGVIFTFLVSDDRPHVDYSGWHGK